MAKNEVQPLSEKEAWNWLQKEHPKVSQHLEPFTVACQKRQDQGEYWWELRSCDYYQYFEQSKIIFPDICKGPRFFLDRSGVYLANTGYILGVDDPYLLGILNSRVFWFAISHISIPFGVRAGEYRYRLIYQYMEKVPIKELHVGNELDQVKGIKLRDLVGQMLGLNEKRPLVNAPHDQTRLQRQIEATDWEIDRLVYDLYELTDEEIAIVEGTAVASSEEVCDNDVHERPNPTQSGTGYDQTAPVASPTQHAEEGGRGPSASAQGTGDPVHGIREPTPHYGSLGNAFGDSPEELGSTRYFTTSQGTLSYSQLAERLGVNLAGLLERLLHIPPVEIEISPGWLCERHKELAGDLFPDWVGRYRDLNVQVGQHTPPPYYEVPTYMRLFCDDLRERLRHLPPEAANVQELAALLAWVDWRFQWIHPFKDFNGRIGRVLLAALLYKLALPHVETAPLAVDVRQPYLSALRAADEGDLGPPQMCGYIA